MRSDRKLHEQGTNNVAVEAVSLIVQLHLQQNRTDLALKEVLAAKKWAQDNLLINVAESWVGLRVVSLFFRSWHYIKSLTLTCTGRREVPGGILRF